MQPNRCAGANLTSFERQLGILGKIGGENKPKVGVESILGRARGADKPTKPQTIKLNFAAAPNSPFKADGMLASPWISLSPTTRVLPGYQRLIAVWHRRMLAPACSVS
ncbi:hypothetical protein N5V81_13675 [Escherichia coli]|nr:hypothetical protein [Escherichia coli]